VEELLAGLPSQSAAAAATVREDAFAHAQVTVPALAPVAAPVTVADAAVYDEGAGPDDDGARVPAASVPVPSPPPDDVPRFYAPFYGGPYVPMPPLDRHRTRVKS